MSFAGYVTLGIWMSIYFLPAIIAGFRNHHNTAAILVLNLFLGWTGLGWIASLVWSATAVARA
jgi:Superinfection immunity protein